jgi:hypothetical protein
VLSNTRTLTARSWLSALAAVDWRKIYLFITAASALSRTSAQPMRLDENPASFESE